MTFSDVLADSLRRCRPRWWSRETAARAADELPLRAELYSVEQMAEHGAALAASHTQAKGHAPDQLLARLTDNEDALIEASRLLAATVGGSGRISPAGEWLLDNFYLIEEQVRTARRHLPKGYSRELPRLAGGPSAGCPRVYDVALNVVAHGDGRVDADSLGRFVAAYQSVTTLKLGELWAIPIMLRLAVIENLRRVSMSVMRALKERSIAETWADEMIKAAETDPKSLILVIADMARSNPPMGSAFVAELMRRLQRRGPALALPLSWMEQRLLETGLDIAQQVRAENQQQAADQVSVSNSIASLRLLGATDWRKFVESMSHVEQTLQQDPAGVYARMDFATRDRYRHVTEEIARRSPCSEVEVAAAALTLARCAESGGDPQREHVGFHLIGSGRAALETAVKCRPGPTARTLRTLHKGALPVYLGTIGAITVGIVVLLLPLLRNAVAPEWLWLPILCALALATSQLAVTLTNWLATLLVSPQALPRMDFSDGIPGDARTIVVIPTMLIDPENVEDLIASLEVRFLANRDANLHFGLLTDLLDANEAVRSDDAELVALASQRITALNLKYGETASHFFLFHRGRRWNPQERVWMGHERKRGKLADLNALLRGHGYERFTTIVGTLGALDGVRYVITLDTDTQLPRDVARELVGAMAHPLNHPRHDPRSGRVMAGYGILQPRVSVSLPGTNRSRYARLNAGEPGLDPYTRVVSDVYQDVFGEGSFIGKGIYAIDAFDRSQGNGFPENSILSHDLLEGCHARAGLLSDVQLYEDHPLSYAADVSRRIRWIRGDWQLAGWLLRTVPCACKANGQGGVRSRNALSALSRWKLFDNLRRSLVAPALTLLFLGGWIWLPASTLWTIALVGLLLTPGLCSTLVALSRKPADVLLRQHLAGSIEALGHHVLHTGFTLVCLPYEAYFSLDAILRTAWRMLVSRRHLLEWTPSSEVERRLAGRDRHALSQSFRRMWIAPTASATITVGLATTHPQALLAAAPLLLLWACSPLVAWWISRPLVPRRAVLSSDQRGFLRGLARRTWAYFDTYVCAADNWLPPDNYQEYRVSSVAHRTSPTNIGMALLANLAAYDFGYIGAARLIERTTATFSTLARLERYRGHFYNWYDTETLAVLPPLYVSTVDSGNLAGHLLTLRAGLTGVAEDRIVAPQLLAGLADTLAQLEDSATASHREELATFRATLATASAAFSASPCDLPGLRVQLARLAQAANLLEHHANDRAAIKHEGHAANGHEATCWAAQLASTCREALADVDSLAPWLTLTGVLPNESGLAQLKVVPSLRELAQTALDCVQQIETRCTEPLDAGQQAWLAELASRVAIGGARARARIASLDRLADECTGLADMDHDFLFDRSRQLLSIGYNVPERRADTGYYDLLASEARLASFVAIAQGRIPQESWFALGRLLTRSAGDTVLLSWSGSMFEYLMPMLVMPSYENTLLDQTCRAAVANQIEYGRQCGVPWGISESGYNMVDVHLNYQYRAFGVPGLGLKRGLADDLVIAPYASAMALMVAPEAACANLQRLAANGHMGRFGLFEAIDHTPSRQRRGESHVAVRAFMAHHQGMSLLALAHVLLDKPMQRRFASDRQFQAAMLLLQERVPKAVALFSHIGQLSEAGAILRDNDTPVRAFDTPDTPMPAVQLLSNGRYHVMVTNAGGGYSRWQDLAVTRWREDGTRDHHGSFCYINDLTDGIFWSATYQPSLRRPSSYAAIFSEGRAEFRRQDALANGGALETYTEIVVSQEDDIELRRLRITNHSRTPRTIELTSYAEVVIAPAVSDALHPAFSKLFVQTEIMPARSAILCMRRPRSTDEAAPWMLHLMAVHGADVVARSFETDRERFTGRTRDLVQPAALQDTGPLSNSAGAVLDPIVAIRQRFVVPADQSVTIDIVTGIAASREQALLLVDKYLDQRIADRVFDLTWTHSQVALRQLNASEADAQLHARLAGMILHAQPAMRADAPTLLRNRRGQSGLWSYAISGDLPIVLLQIGDAANIALVRQLVQAHAYWQQKGLAVDLVIWNEDHAGYRQQLQEQIMSLVGSDVRTPPSAQPGRIFVRSAEQIPAEDRTLIQSVARIILSDSCGSLLEQLDQHAPGTPLPSRLTTTPASLSSQATAGDDAQPERALILSNGLGGFTADGREYVMQPGPGRVTPAPWVNVLANPQFGTVISESGAAYTWSENAHAFRLSPWHNDPVSDTSGEAFYLRDEDSGEIWSPTPLPAGSTQTFTVRHGFGYSVFETRRDGVHSELWVFVAIDASIKFSVLKLHNHSGRPRRLSATGYLEWVLGDLRERSAMHVSTEIDPHSGALFARNPFNQEFAERVAFFDADGGARSVSSDRMEFLGRNGNPARPAAMQRSRLSGRVGAGLDPCAAIQIKIELADGEAHDLCFRLGAGRNGEDASRLARQFRGHAAAYAALDAVNAHWNHTLGAIHVETPDPALNVLTNGWLVVQTLACRLWARSGYYQSGGAFGFRDQLQDGMALMHVRPELLREHLLLCASRQFREGDVQHWWHPPSGRGVRTRCSDDYLWLPLATCRYIEVSGDTGVLDAPIAFLEGRAVNPEDDGYYDLPGQSSETATLYEHCVLAIRHGLRFGSHGLPLIGSGDWNDGMNLVGIRGQGESIWLGFFLHAVLLQFGTLADARDPAFATHCRAQAETLRQNLEAHGWDGEWYRRAYFDDGTPLGSASNTECSIDSISQSWSVLSGAGDAARARLAMRQADERLTRPQAGLMQLLDPPFDRSTLNPGYIKGYVPGVRENGGQYTHAAIWAAMAFADLGDSTHAWQLLRLINPVNHALDRAACARYRLEPYVLAADVYAVVPHVGRGGWSWYTGSAGWMYRLVTESLLGVKRRGDMLTLTPCLPPEWPGYILHYRYRSSITHITVTQTAAPVGASDEPMSLVVDGVAQSGRHIQLHDDQREHWATVTIHSATPPSVANAAGTDPGST